MNSWRNSLGNGLRPLKLSKGVTWHEIVNGDVLPFQYLAKATAKRPGDVSEDSLSCANAFQIKRSLMEFFDDMSFDS